MVSAADYATFKASTTMAEMARTLAAATFQLTFPVLDQGGLVLGAVSATSIGALAPESGMQMLAVAADILQPEAKVAISDHLGTVRDVHGAPLTSPGQAVTYLSSVNRTFEMAKETG